MSAKRLVPAKVSPEIYRCVVKFDELIDASTLGKELIELIKVRVSQINGCAYCIDTHTLMARKTGISERKLYLLNAWSEAPLYNPRERAALGWADALTRLTKTHADDEYYEPLILAHTALPCLRLPRDFTHGVLPPSPCRFFSLINDRSTDRSMPAVVIANRSLRSLSHSQIRPRNPICR